ncbi:MAG: site-specific DNA-methyltransferase [Acidimicrobiales bacterium]
MTTRKATSTSNFGVGRRENHDASGFYARFEPPVFSDDDALVAHDPAEPLMVGDARDMAELPDGCVALVVTSPPYFAGKAYEEELGAGPIPGSYLEYLAMLRAVFAECARVLEPGGRIAVNVANLGRKPYRSLAADVIHILQDDLHLLLRGEIIWQKARGAGGSCAWGTFGSARNPVLRDVTERVIVAGKGRLDRARTRQQRAEEGHPHLDTITNDDYVQATLDVWELAPERATRVDHPAPFPVELPLRLINLYTFVGDLVLDPFLGSGTTAVAAARAGRRWVGFDTEPAYIDIAHRRVAAERAVPGADPYLVEAVERGQSMGDLATAALEEAGFVEISPRPVPVPGLGLKVARTALDASGRRWWFDLTGGFTTPAPVCCAATRPWPPSVGPPHCGARGATGWCCSRRGSPPAARACTARCRWRGPTWSSTRSRCSTLHGRARLGRLRGGRGETAPPRVLGVVRPALSRGLAPNRDHRDRHRPGHARHGRRRLGSVPGRRPWSTSATATGTRWLPPARSRPRARLRLGLGQRSGLPRCGRRPPGPDPVAGRVEGRRPPPHRGRGSRRPARRPRVPRQLQVPLQDPAQPVADGAVRPLPRPAGGGAGARLVRRDRPSPLRRAVRRRA